MVQVEHLYKTYPGPSHALRDVTFTAPSGMVTYILGKSGAGKSTLLNILSGSILPTSGHIYFAQRRIADLSSAELIAWRRQLGMIYQDFRLLPNRSIKENILLPLIIRNTPKAQAHHHVQHLAKALEIEDILNKLPHQVSGGQQQRAAIARAIIHQPKFVLADEPTGALDPHNSKIVFQTLHSLASEGKCVIVATHNHEMIGQFNHYQVVTLEKGQLVSSSSSTPSIHHLSYAL